MHEWDLGCDGVVEFRSNRSGDFSKTYHRTGVYTACYRVTDDGNATAEERVFIEVRKAPAPARLTPQTWLAYVILIVGSVLLAGIVLSDPRVRLWVRDTFGPVWGGGSGGAGAKPRTPAVATPDGSETEQEPGDEAEKAQ